MSEPLHVVTPCPVLAMRALSAALWRLEGMAATYQALKAETVGFALADGRVVAALGFYPTGLVSAAGAAIEEVFLLGLPAAAVRPHLPALTRLARLTLGRRLHSANVAFVAFVKAGHAPGQRLARLAGFTPDGAAGGAERYVRQRHGQDGRGDRKPVQRSEGHGGRGGDAGGLGRQ